MSSDCERRVYWRGLTYRGTESKHSMCLTLSPHGKKSQSCANVTGAHCDGRGNWCGFCASFAAAAILHPQKPIKREEDPQVATRNIGCNMPHPPLPLVSLSLSQLARNSADQKKLQVIFEEGSSDGDEHISRGSVPKRSSSGGHHSIFFLRSKIDSI